MLFGKVYLNVNSIRILHNSQSIKTNQLFPFTFNFFLMDFVAPFYHGKKKLWEMEKICIKQ